MKSDVALSVFCPEGWHGITNLVPLQLEFSKELPRHYRPKLRPVKPELMGPVKIEFDRLCTYMYVPSDSPIASPLVVAPKATYPFHRMCGDYVFINQYILKMQHHIPLVFNELEKASKGRVFIDFDMKNAFHQIVLDKFTSLMLSVLTMWGVVRPVYMPEDIHTQYSND